MREPERARAVRALLWQPRHTLCRIQTVSTGGEFLWAEKVLAEDSLA